MVGAGHTLICIPYDSGYRNLRMGAGPMLLIEAGAARCLEQFGAVSFATLEAYLSFQTEIGTAFARAVDLIHAPKIGRSLSGGTYLARGRSNCIDRLLITLCF